MGRICVSEAADAEKTVNDAFLTLARQLIPANF
jgi:hypothetical protein